MPGVPTSRGCDGCRKSKKKCDELQPCSRCAKRQIVCQGSGQRRYKFQSLQVPKGAPDKLMPVVSVSTQQPVRLHISHVPNDTLTLMFVNSLEIRDVRYDIAYYGSFLRDLPRRLGSSPALDAASMALVSAHPYFQTKDIPPMVLSRFGKALRTLRDCLNDSKEARSPKTLCAIYLIAICQGWIGKSGKQRSTHSEAIMHLLKAVDLNQYEAGFPRDLILTLCVPVILEGIRDPLIQLPRAFWEHMVVLLHQDPPPPPYNAIPRPHLTVLELSRFPEYLHNPHLHLPEITSTYKELQNDSQKMFIFMGQDLMAMLPDILQSRYRAAYTLVAAVALLLNTILRSFDPSDTTLTQESALFTQSVIEGADRASCDRPLGAAYILPCLIIAMAASDNKQQAAQIEGRLIDYQSDFKTLEWRNCVAWLRSVFENHRMFGRLVKTDLDIDISELGVPGGCAMM